jgi:flavorubredoxin
MKIGIIVHSCTGNTLCVAQRLQEKLSAAGHSASIQRVSAINDDESDAQKIRLSQKPDVSAYDVLIFGAPVRGFSLSPVMQAYLSGIGSLANKKTACFLTEFFPSPRMGGNRALKQMVDACRSKGAALYGTGIVNWSNAVKRERLIVASVDKLSAIE